MKDMLLERLRAWALAAVSGLMATVCSAQEGGVELRIAHTNDTHSCVMPVSPHSTDTALADKGGMVRRAALVRDLRAEDPSLLLFDCGDFSQGSAYYNLYKGEVEVRLMNTMRYDAATIGNHEFDFGMENMARLFRMARFPVVCSNYDVTGTPLEGLVKPYVVIERDGLRIGLFGLAPQPEGLIQADKCQGVVYKDPIPVAQEMADLLRNEEHCDAVICLSHLGIRGIDPKAMSDEKLVVATSGIDAILGGHSHTFMETTAFYPNAEGRETPVFHTGKNGVYVGVWTLTLTKK